MDDKDKILSLIKEDELAKLAMDLVDIPSPTGQEQEVGECVLGWLRDNGIKATGQEVEQGRINAVGYLPGSGGGVSLQFNSHLDTSWGIDSDVLALGETSRVRLPKAFREGDKIFGEGIVNDKGPLACFLIAAKAIKDSGVVLKGDLVLAGVCGEIGRAQIDEFQGPAYRSKGLGTRYLLTHGFATDYAVVAEPSQFAVTWALPGVAYVKISTKGKTAYTPFTDRSRNSIIRMMDVLAAISGWAEQYEEKNIYRFHGGEIHPKVNIGAVRGGLPNKPNHSPARCSVYIDIRTPPGRDPYKVADQLRKALSSHDVEFEVYLSRRGYEAQGVESLVAAAETAHEQVFGSKPQQIAPGYTSMWNDNNIYSELAIPSVKIGPSPKDSTGDYDYNYLGDLVSAAKIYALIALNVCGTWDVVDYRD